MPAPTNRASETPTCGARYRSCLKRQAQVIALVYLEDRTVADVAVILEFSENTVRTHLGRARRSLAQRLGVEAAADEEEA